MDQERWRKIDEWYHAALEREPTGCGAYLACADDGLRSEVESPLGYEQRGDDLLEEPPA